MREKNRELNIATVGVGPAHETIVRLARQEHPARRGLPKIRLIASAGEDLPEQYRDAARAAGGACYPTFQQMLAAHPEINVLALLSEDPQAAWALRRETPQGVSILDQAALPFLQELAIMSEESGKCKMELREGRSLLQTMMDEIQDDVLFLDSEQRILDVNRHVCDRLGKTREELLNRPCREAAGQGESLACPAGETSCPFHLALRRGRDAEAMHTLVDAEGRVRYFHVRAFPVSPTGEYPTKVIEVRRDVTLRTEMEKRLQQAEKLAAIGELSTYIAHEIRNPLFAIGGFANALLRSPELDENARQKVRIILEESKRLDNILKSIINFVRPTVADSSEVDVNLVLQDTIRLMSIGCEERNIHVQLQLADPVAKARGDAELLKQCLINVIKNALEAMPEGGTLRLATGMSRDEVFISIKDTGVGIPVQDQEMIFNPFFTTKKNRGSGLGLAMTKKIITDLGGSLELTSQVGQGTAVTIHLPPFAAVEP